MTPDFSQSTALYGGSFDPIHNGHIHVAKAVAMALPGTKVIWVPASRSPGKNGPIASAEQRLRWLGLAGLDCWDTEILRGGESYTVETLAEAHRLGARRELLFWVVGADSYRQISHWKEPERLRELCRIIAVNRPGSELPPRVNDDIIVPVSPHPASSSAIRACLATNQVSEDLPLAVRLDLESLILHSKNPYVRKTE